MAQKINQKQYGKKYSTTEQLTGDVWIDGKPIYRRSFTGTISQAASTRNSVTLIASGVETIINGSGYWDAGGTFMVPVGSTVTSTTALNTAYGSEIRLQSNAASLLTVSSSARSSAPYHVTIEYTKT